MNSSSLMVSFLLFSLLSFSFSAQSNRKDLRRKSEVNQKPIVQLGSSNGVSRINPSQVTQLSWHPRVFLYKSFLSEEECDHLISLGHKELHKSLVKSNGSRSILNASPVLFANSMTSSAITQDAIVSRIEERASAWTFIPEENGEILRIHHYAPEKTNNSSLQYYEDKVLSGPGQPVLATLVLYLSNVTQGGETLFPESELRSTQTKDGTWSDCASNGYAVKPTKGNALLFFNLQPSAIPDKNSLHTRCPVLQGEKWCAIKLFRLRITDENKKTKDVLEPENNDCTDEDDRCIGWAAVGECQKNPVFMIGTPDYYGSCRKSCKSC